jgi:hypothetical protein
MPDVRGSALARLRWRGPPRGRWRLAGRSGILRAVKSPPEEPEDGVIKFSADHESVALCAARHTELAGVLVAWRAIFAHLGAIGQAAARYGGVGFGNVSGRLGPFPGAPGARPFLITGTQTGGRDCLALSDFCAVDRWDVRRNAVRSRGGHPAVERVDDPRGPLRPRSPHPVRFPRALPDAVARRAGVAPADLRCARRLRDAGHGHRDGAPVPGDGPCGGGACWPWVATRTASSRSVAPRRRPGARSRRPSPGPTPPPTGATVASVEPEAGRPSADAVDEDAPAPLSVVGLGDEEPARCRRAGAPTARGRGRTPPPRPAR